MVDESKIYVTKRSGEQESLNLDKIHKVVSWSCEGIKGVSASEIEMRSQLKFFEGITTREIHSTLIRTAADLTSEESPNYQIVASKLLNYQIRKDIYGRFEPNQLYTVVQANVERGVYTPELLNWYTEEEFMEMDKAIVHNRDFDIVYAGMEQWVSKYLVQNRVTKEKYETPQIAYMLIAATAFNAYPQETRLKHIKNYYNSLSNFDITIPTPVLAGLRTDEKQFSSCTGISVGDSLDSIKAANSAIIDYVSRKAGIGLSVGRIRSEGSPIRGGKAVHTGVTPFLKAFQGSLRSCSQGAIRNGSMTTHIVYFHPEIENQLVLKNNKGTEDNRVRQMDYSFTVNRLFYKRVIADDQITLFNPSDVPDLMKAFYHSDNDAFEALYEKYEADPRFKNTKKISAYTLLERFIDERVNTGRIYLLNIDNANHHSPYDPDLHPIEQSNLCQEILLPSTPMGETVLKKKTIKLTLEKELEQVLAWVKDKEVITFERTEVTEDGSVYALTLNGGRIFLCTLSAINWGNIRKPDDFEKPMEYAVRALDAILSYQDYPLIESELATRDFRTLGIGINNLAYFLAKHGVKYDESALELVDEYMEAMSYYAIKASVQLAKEFGPCDKFHETKWAKGEFPWERRAKKIDDLVPFKLRKDWEGLRADMLKYGIRNASLLANMPSESSSQLVGATNGIEPPRTLISKKKSKDGVLKLVVPEFAKLKNKYDLLWEQNGAEGYLKVVGVISKYICQATSANTSYNPQKFDDKIPFDTIAKDIFMHYNLGGTTLYYNNIYDGATDDYAEEDPKKAAEEQPLEQVAEEFVEDDCSACKL
jgi:ribonucleoside-diphosphate reductase alpha chain